MLESRNHSCHVDVRLSDLDRFAEVQPGQLLSLLDFARWKMFSEMGIRFAQYEGHGYPKLVPVHVELSFSSSAGMGDRLEIRSRFVEVLERELRLEQRIFKGESEVLTAVFSFICRDDEGRPIPLPEGIR